MPNLKDINGNSLSELMGLMRSIRHQIDEYKHIEEFLPKSLTKELDKFQDKLNKEYDRREKEI